MTVDILNYAIAAEMFRAPRRPRPERTQMKKSLDLAAIVLTSLFLLLLAIASILGILDPAKASIGYGMPTSDAAGALFYRVFASRNLVIVAAGLAFLLLRLWTPLAILVTLTAALAIFDMAVLSTSGVTPPAFHAVTLAFIVITSALLWRRATTAEA
jgi:hypothetical protein